MRRFVLVLLALGLALPVSAKPQRRTVLDYFKMLPASGGLFELPGERMSFLREKRQVVDTRNNFLHLRGDGAQPSLAIAVFRFRGRDVVAVETIREGSNLSFWRERNGRLVNVTDQAFPIRLPKQITHEHLPYGTTLRVGWRNSLELPRYGTTLRVFQDANSANKREVARFVWRKGRFVRG